MGIVYKTKSVLTAKNKKEIVPKPTAMTKDTEKEIIAEESQSSPSREDQLTQIIKTQQEVLNNVTQQQTEMSQAITELKKG
jgi:hypothetical protein